MYIPTDMMDLDSEADKWWWIASNNNSNIFPEFWSEKKSYCMEIPEEPRSVISETMKCDSCQ